MKHQVLFNSIINPPVPEVAMESVHNNPTSFSELEPDSKDRYILNLNSLLADVFTLHLKCKSFHWHLKGHMFYSNHEMLDEHAKALYDITDDIAERVRKLGCETIRSIEDVKSLRQIPDQTSAEINANQMLAELWGDNDKLVESLKSLKKESERHEDPATGAMIDVWIDQAEKRAWFLKSSFGQ